MVLSVRELDKLANLWDNHRSGCSHRGDAEIRLFPGGGIGTVVVVICGCGRKLDVTDYASW